MRIADLNDIRLELWLRERGDRELGWITKDGREIPIRDMSIEHLRNVARMLDGKEEFSQLVYEAKLDTIDAGRDW